ncbi:hypothetical protein [Chondrinema litorale]|uniref:hypothetical protein n=1 Tax=Chondrinema litorale TaxID=2994555 RepID=UPI002543857D|nr:hypothetical protein [Chondrinema litorale]UZR96387.1 hypothetical protein OQ292_22280 [Chondrinema litorale]
MKSIISILLVSLFLVQITTRVWIVFSFKINQEYIARNLCEKRDEAITMCYGSCYLKKKLKKTEESNTQQLPSTLKLKFETLYFSEYKLQMPFAENIIVQKDYNSFYHFIKSNCALQGVFRPPQGLS